jgi:hypothetical protein
MRSDTPSQLLQAFDHYLRAGPTQVDQEGAGFVTARCTWNRSRALHTSWGVSQPSRLNHLRAGPIAPSFTFMEGAT